jgi:hypothetical protein
MQPITRPTETWKFIHESDKALPEDQQTIFTLEPLSLTEEMAAIEAQQAIATNPVSGERVVRDRKWTAALEMFCAHVVDIENFPPGANGGARKWPRSGSIEERLEYASQFSSVVIYDIAQAIFNRGLLSDDAKNS